MALTGQQTIFGIVVTFLALLLFFELMPSTGLAAFGNTLGIIITAMGLIVLVIAALMKRGVMKPRPAWARTAVEAAWSGIGMLALGLGNLSNLVVAENLALKLRMTGALVFIVAILAARRSVRAAALT
jgi:hypothetical protein